MRKLKLYLKHIYEFYSFCDKKYLYSQNQCCGLGEHMDNIEHYLLVSVLLLDIHFSSFVQLIVKKFGVGIYIYIYIQSTDLINETHNTK